MQSITKTARAACFDAAPRSSAFLRLNSTVVETSGEPRPLEYWLARTPPGWISRHAARSANPIALATEIRALGTSFVGWLRQPPQERWDTFTLQSLSAALFNRFQLDLQRRAGRTSDPSVELLQLAWPSGSERVQDHVAALQRLLAAPFAVFKACRTPLAAADFPTRREVRMAEDALEAVCEELDRTVRELGQALEAYAAANRETNAGRNSAPGPGTMNRTNFL